MFRDGLFELEATAALADDLSWTDEDWATARERIRATDARDKSNRTVEAKS